MADRFYTPQPLGRGDFVLDGPEAHHLTAVRRFGPGDAVILFNGDGREYSATIVAIGKRTVTLSIESELEGNRERAVPLIVASAMPKGDRGDFLIEKLTELGVTRFVPLLTTRTVVQPKESKVEKFERAVIEASKQCGRNMLMQIDPPQRWDMLIRECKTTRRLVFHPLGGEPLQPATVETILAIGPEGGFTPEEVTLAKDYGWQIVTLGPRILRIETAAIAAAAIL